MPAPKRVPDGAIAASLERWRGNVTAAAREVEMAPTNFRKRLAALGLQPARSARTVARLQPAQLDALRQAKYDIQARERRDLDESLILQRFFAAAFESWLRAELEARS
jgi:hypothetical protein